MRANLLKNIDLERAKKPNFLNRLLKWMKCLIFSCYGSNVLKHRWLHLQFWFPAQKCNADRRVAAQKNARSQRYGVKMAKVRRQLRRLGNDLTTMHNPTGFWSLFLDILHRRKMTMVYKAYISAKIKETIAPMQPEVTRCVSSPVVSDVPSRDL